MGLIDADELKKELYQQWFMDILLTQRNIEDMFYALAQKIDKQPTAYDVDKVVERLEKEKNPLYREDGSLMGERTLIGIDKAIEIVKGGGVDGQKQSQ